MKEIRQGSSFLDALLKCVTRLFKLACRFRSARLDQVKVDAEGCQVLAQAIVQFAGQPPPLLILRVQ